jgi:hypothetical protein
MKIKTSELTGTALDWAVASAEGAVWAVWAVWRFKERHAVGEMRYSTSWSQGGPIIERERIDVRYFGPLWSAALQLNEYEEPDEFFGPTPLIAAMRCFVASRLGDEVDIPEELT